MAKKRKSKHNPTTFELLSDKSPFAYAEAFKTFRTNVEFVSATYNCRAIMMVSALSGEGYRSASINLAFALAQDGK